MNIFPHDRSQESKKANHRPVENITVHRIDLELVFKTYKALEISK